MQIYRLLLSTAITFCMYFPAFGQENTSDKFYESGMAYLSRKEYFNAIREFTEAISIRSAYPEALYQRALAKKFLNEELGYQSSELCQDLIAAYELGYTQALNPLIEQSSTECFTLDAALMEPEKVYCGDFSNSSLNLLPLGISKMKNMINLVLIDNNLNIIPEEISTMPRMISIDISNNKFETLKGILHPFPSVVYLIATDNAISDIDPEIGNLKDLNTLNLSNNFLTSLPSEFSNLKKLKDLDLSFNQLSEIPAVLFEMNQLQNLDLFGNEIPNSDLEKLKSALPNTKIRH